MSRQHDERHGDVSAYPHPSVTVDVVVFAMFGSLDGADDGRADDGHADDGHADDGHADDSDGANGRSANGHEPAGQASNGHTPARDEVHYRASNGRPAAGQSGDAEGGEGMVGDEPALRVLLVRRRGEPFQGCWAIPGGFVRMDESLDDAARRELEEETSLREVYLEQLYTFGAPGRDPRTRVISVAYYALLPGHVQEPRASDEVGEARWFPVTRLPGNLAFDHAEILDVALRRLRAKADYAGIAREFLPPRFTLRRLRRIYETVLGRRLDRANFARRILFEDDIEETGEIDRSGAHRPAKLYRYRRDRVHGTRDKE